MLTRLAPVGTIAGLAGRVPLLPWADRFRGLAGFGSMLGNYEFGGIDPRVPERSFTGAPTLDVGGRSVELSFVGPAHTVGDAIAWVPDARVRLRRRHPLQRGDADHVGGTRRQLDRRPRADRGAGAGDGSRRPRPARRRRRGRGRCASTGSGCASRSWPPARAPTLGALAERLVRSSDFEPWRGWRNPERTLVNVARIAATERGGGSEIGTAERMRLIAGMGALAERLR